MHRLSLRKFLTVHAWLGPYGCLPHYLEELQKCSFEHRHMQAWYVCKYSLSLYKAHFARPTQDILINKQNLPGFNIIKLPLSLKISVAWFTSLWNIHTSQKRMHIFNSVPKINGALFSPLSCIWMKKFCISLISVQL